VNKSSNVLFSQFAGFLISCAISNLPELETVEAGLAAEFTQTPEGVSLESRQLVSEFSCTSIRKT
jgi:hypothetical protein